MKKHKKIKDVKNMAAMIPINVPFVVKKRKCKSFSEKKASQNDIKFILEQANKFEKQRKNTVDIIL